MTGRPPKQTAAEICYIVATHPDPVVTATDVHERMQMTRRGAQKRLDQLHDDGYLEKKKVGSAGAIYWLTNKGRQSLD